MIPKEAEPGDDTAGLLYYLYGPGKRDEHVDPHMVAAWDPFVPDPVKSEDFSIADLAMLLDAPVRALTGRKPPLHVFHVAVRNPPEDRLLTDEEWARVAREMMHAAGIAPHTDDQGCRWVAVRHADDHIHIVATRAREDDRQPDTSWSKLRMQEAARGFEIEFGLRRLAHADGTARRWSKTGEADKATRRGLSEPVRETLQRTVREAAAAAVSDADFFARLAAAGLRVKQRIAPDGNTTGYSVALPGDRDSGQKPVFFPGTKLAPDLSLPRVRERWSGPPVNPAATPADAWRAAAAKVRAAADQLGAGGLHEGAGDVAALGDLIVTAAVVSPYLVRSQMRTAAYEYERASRAPAARQMEGQARQLYRESNQVLARSVSAVGRNDTVAALGLLLALVTAVEASRRWHQAQEHRIQAEAAGRAGRLLHEAVEVTVGVNAAREYKPRAKRTAPRAGTGRRAVTAPGTRPMVGTVQEAIPDHAQAVLADPAWPALRARLVEVEVAGDDPGDVLATVAARRELNSADSVAEVLVWRLDGWQRQRSSAAAASGSGTTAAPAGGPGRGAPARKQGAPSPTRRPPGEEQQRKGPKRGR
ncbi:mobilization protein [Streptomyces xanthochromogenes]|uniref:relaxase/mobilization nuclease domain-containing protein n=1 Tax=Streptomyces xanthochromogenes TaxID=67384 RepID=UPI00167A9FF6|nr:mobilization protein [Streptomyces xanthochromogenes]GHB76067.1 mobilization protein [Streptomyces xanthochromogenes]